MSTDVANRGKTGQEKPAWTGTADISHPRGGTHAPTFDPQGPAQATHLGDVWARDSRSKEVNEPAGSGCRVAGLWVLEAGTDAGPPSATAFGSPTHVPRQQPSERLNMLEATSGPAGRCQPPRGSKPITGGVPPTQPGSPWRTAETRTRRERQKRRLGLARASRTSGRAAHRAIVTWRHGTVQGARQGQSPDSKGGGPDR